MNQDQSVRFENTLPNALNMCIYKEMVVGDVPKDLVSEYAYLSIYEKILGMEVGHDDNLNVITNPEFIRTCKSIESYLLSNIANTDRTTHKTNTMPFQEVINTKYKRSKSKFLELPARLKRIDSKIESAKKMLDIMDGVRDMHVKNLMDSTTKTVLFRNNPEACMDIYRSRNRSIADNQDYYDALKEKALKIIQSRYRMPKEYIIAWWKWRPAELLPQDLFPQSATPGHVERYRNFWRRRELPDCLEELQKSGRDIYDLIKKNTIDLSNIQAEISEHGMGEAELFYNSVSRTCATVFASSESILQRILLECILEYFELLRKVYGHIHYMASKDIELESENDDVCKHIEYHCKCEYYLENAFKSCFEELGINPMPSMACIIWKRIIGNPDSNMNILLRGGIPKGHDSFSYISWAMHDFMSGFFARSSRTTRKGKTTVYLTEVEQRIADYRAEKSKNVTTQEQIDRFSEIIVNIGNSLRANDDLMSKLRSVLGIVHQIPRKYNDQYTETRERLLIGEEYDPQKKQKISHE